jgi:hypothetical protein
MTLITSKISLSSYNLSACSVQHFCHVTCGCLHIFKGLQPFVILRREINCGSWEMTGIVAFLEVQTGGIVFRLYTVA